MSFDNTSGFSTAVALVNTDSIVGDYLIAFYDEAGSRIGTGVIGLNSSQHSAVSLPVRFPETAGKRGFFELSRIPPGGGAARPSNAAIIALRFNPTGPFSIVPAMDLP